MIMDEVFFWVCIRGGDGVFLAWLEEVVVEESHHLDLQIHDYGRGVLVALVVVSAPSVTMTWYYKWTRGAVVYAHLLEIVFLGGADYEV